jgi:hypothetical protein
MMGRRSSTCGREKRCRKDFGGKNLRGEDHLEARDVKGSILLKRIFRKWDGKHGLDRAGSGQIQVAGFCECGSEPSGSIKCVEFPNLPRT